MADVNEPDMVQLTVLSLNLSDLNDPLPFHAWKGRVVASDGYRREREWYYKEYGRYCQNVRRLVEVRP